jgi:hypothetical protein
MKIKIKEAFQHHLHHSRTSFLFFWLSSSFCVDVAIDWLSFSDHWVLDRFQIRIDLQVSFDVHSRLPKKLFSLLCKSISFAQSLFVVVVVEFIYFLFFILTRQLWQVRIQSLAHYRMAKSNEGYIIAATCPPLSSLKRVPFVRIRWPTCPLSNSMAVGTLWVAGNCHGYGNTYSRVCDMKTQNTLQHRRRCCVY